MTNTLALVNAGIMKADGTVLKKNDDIRGGEIVMGADGTPTGLLKEQAGTYTRSFLDNDNLFSVDVAKETMQKIENHLLSEGYTMYIDGWGNYFYTDNLYKAAQQMDKAGDMQFVLGLTYEFESWMPTRHVNLQLTLKNTLASTSRQIGLNFSWTARLKAAPALSTRSIPTDIRAL